MTIVVGLTGGIASGKSFISKHLIKKKYQFTNQIKLLEIFTTNQTKTLRYFLN